MITRIVRRKRPRPWAVVMAMGAIVVAGLMSAVALAVVINDTHVGASCDIQVGDQTGFDFCPTTAGARIEYIGDKNTTFGSSGTGTFNSFLRTQATPTSTGYNTDGTLEFNSKAGNWTHAIPVSDIPVITFNGALYWELFADINESNNHKVVSLNDLEVFFTDDQFLTGYSFGTNAEPIYDFDGDALINDVNQGSGRGDLRFLIPVANIDIPDDCNYGNALCDTFFVLYTGWGFTDGFKSDGGFEEWKVKIYPVLANPVITTLIVPAGPLAIGATAHDTATLTGETADAGGTVTYKLYANNDCTGEIDDLTPTLNAVVNGVVPDSDSYTFNTAGTFYFWASYSGDAGNNPDVSGCADEPLTIGQNRPAAHSTPLVQIRDTFSVSPFAAPPAGNTEMVHVGLFSDSACTTLIADETFAVPAAGGTVSGMTNWYTALAGDFFYKITYAGDTNNAAVDSGCVEKVDIASIVSIP